MSELQGFQYLANRLEMAAVPLVLLHGSSRDERDLVPLADDIAPVHPYVAPRGRVAWEDGFAFFRRHPDRTLDYVDLGQQTQSLIGFLEACQDRKLLQRKPVLLGFSNGAIMAASILLRLPQAISGAILLRPLSPAPSAGFPDLSTCPVLVATGDHDPRRAPEDGPLLAAQLRAAGAPVTTLSLPTGHGLHRDEPGLIRNWLRTLYPGK